jgi:hypothetical protein
MMLGSYKLAHRAFVGVLGATVVLLGIAMIVLPGPGAGPESVPGSSRATAAATTVGEPSRTVARWRCVACSLPGGRR